MRVSTLRRTTLPLPKPFELELALHGHGWILLAPHRYDERSGVWTVPLRLGDARRLGAPLGHGYVVADVDVHQRARELHLEVHFDAAPPKGALAEARAQVARMLRLDADLSAFWKACREHEHLAWTARRGAGRLLRSASLFEDLVKLLFTTNCSWAATESMTQKLVDALGDPTPRGLRAFPTPAQCCRDERFWREVVRVGYRARACRELAEHFAEGRLDDARFDDPTLSTVEVRKRLCALHGFGPYAAGQAMRLLGRYDDLALDSWCRATLTQKLGRKQPPSDRAIARRYATFGAWQGLALWCDLTAEWHGEAGSAAAPRSETDTKARTARDASRG